MKRKLDLKTIIIFTKIISSLCLSFVLVYLSINLINNYKLLKLYRQAEEITNGTEFICKPLIINNKELIYVCKEK